MIMVKLVRIKSKWCDIKKGFQTGLIILQFVIQSQFFPLAERLPGGFIAHSLLGIYHFYCFNIFYSLLKKDIIHE